MRFNGIVVVIYALLVVVGGMVGFIKANSVPSLIMGMVFSLALLLSAVAMVKGIKKGYYAALALTTILAVFFGYRLVVTQHIMPAGIMTVLSVVVFIALLLGNRSRAK